VNSVATGIPSGRPIDETLRIKSRIRFLPACALGQPGMLQLSGLNSCEMPREKFGCHFVGQVDRGKHETG